MPIPPMTTTTISSSSVSLVTQWLPSVVPNTIASLPIPSSFEEVATSARRVATKAATKYQKYLPNLFREILQPSRSFATVHLQRDCFPVCVGWNNENNEEDEEPQLIIVAKPGYVYSYKVPAEGGICKLLAEHSLLPEQDEVLGVKFHMIDSDIKEFSPTSTTLHQINTFDIFSGITTTTSDNHYTFNLEQEQEEKNEIKEEKKHIEIFSSSSSDISSNDSSNSLSSSSSSSSLSSSSSISTSLERQSEEEEILLQEEFR